MDIGIRLPFSIRRRLRIATRIFAISLIFKKINAELIIRYSTMSQITSLKRFINYRNHYAPTSFLAFPPIGVKVANLMVLNARDRELEIYY